MADRDRDAGTLLPIMCVYSHKNAYEWFGLNQTPKAVRRNSRREVSGSQIHSVVHKIILDL